MNDDAEEMEAIRARVQNAIAEAIGKDVMLLAFQTTVKVTSADGLNHYYTLCSDNLDLDTHLGLVKIAKINVNVRAAEILG